MGTRPNGRFGPTLVAPAPDLRVAALGRRVHEHRSAAGFTLQEFAVLAGLSTLELAALEDGDPQTPIAVVLAVAEALDLPAAELLAESAADAAAPPEPAPRAPVYAAPPAVARRPAAKLPRTFADLKVGPLANRAFETLPQFAVAAVVELGHPVWVVAKIFRVPAWKLEAWVRDGVAAPPPARPQRRWA